MGAPAVAPSLFVPAPWGRSPAGDQVGRLGALSIFGTGDDFSDEFSDHIDRQARDPPVAADQ
jgi:hypothetical protein